MPVVIASIGAANRMRHDCLDLGSSRGAEETLVTCRE